MRELDFFDRFIRLLENTKEKHELETIHDALIVWFGENYLFLDPEEVKERIVQDKHAEGVDSVLIDQINYQLFLIQAKTVDNFDNTRKNFPESDIKLTLEGIRFLLRGDYKGKITPRLENLVDEYHDKDVSSDYKTKILFLTLKKKPADNKFLKNFEEDFPHVNIEFFDFDALFNFYENIYLVRRAKPPEKISFKVLTNLLKKDNPHKARAFTVKGEEIAKIYNDYRERIFQQDVRYSLGMRSGSINKQILETATSNSREEHFWYFNNGITIVCKKINEAVSGRIITLDDAQIINGAQTTYALYNAYEKGELKGNVELLIKVIETDNRDFIESVTLYTNSQNAIRLRDLCSNDDIQHRIQKLLLGSYKYFYERKRGEFNSQYPTPEAKRNVLGENYRELLISNENAAQAFLAMYLNKPSEAKAQKRRIFMKDAGGFYDEIFNKKDELLAEKILMSWKLLKYIEMYKREYRKKYNKAEDFPEEKRNEIYKYDFLLYSEYFILNLFRDFLKIKGFDIDAKKDDLLKIISKIDSNDIQIQECYESIKKELAKCMENYKKQPRYYHNKFFKNEKSSGLIRNFFNKRYEFVEVI